jgi:exodeoxyribonuclease V gamma subunit
VPDPCREYWGGLVPEHEPARLRAWRHDEQRRIDAAGAGDWLDDTPSHPLLARWGRLGQHFYAGLADWDASHDIRHGADRVEAVPADRLARVQESIRRLDRSVIDDPEPLAAHVAAAGDDADAREAAAKAWFDARRGDASLRVHACHTRLRELEVLRDVLLDAVGAGIAPGGIVVMAPDIAAYAPLLPAVFGAPGDPREPRLPWHLADAPVMRGHRLFATFARLLDLGASRVTAPEIVDLLAVPEIARALGLDAEAVDRLVGWLASSRAAWALDGAHRGEFGVPPTADNTLGWGLDRMLAGYVMASPGGETPAAVTLPDGTALLPLGGVHGPAAAAVGAFDRLLGELRQWRALARSTRRASEWARDLDSRVSALLRVDPDDADARSAAAAIARMLAALATDTAAAGDPPLHFAVVRDVLLDALAAVPERQRFLRGGITFCGMVPQRAIPFDLVCVLGLDDGAFPRRPVDGGLDLMSRVRLVGDRDVRTDDRWLFLETLMSARKRLHLSFVGHDVRDGSARNPASPLAELVAELERADGAAGLDDRLAAVARPWWVSHPLQPFAPAYFDDRDVALFSHSAAFAAVRGGDGPAAAPFVAGTPHPPDPLPDPLPLAVLSRFWKDPAKDLLARRLQLDLAALDDDALPDSEPLDARLAKLDTVARRVFLAAALPAGVAGDGTPRWDDGNVPDWIALGGLLPPGEAGRVAWRCEATAVRALVRAAHGHGLAGKRAEAIDVAVPLAIDGATSTLRGRVGDVVRGDDGALHLVRAFPKAAEREKDALCKVADLDFGKRVPMFVDWAALRLHTAADAAPPAVRLAVLAHGDLPLAAAVAAWDADFLAAAPATRAARIDDLRDRLGALAALWWRAAAEPPVYFPKAASAACVARGKATAKSRVPFAEARKAAAGAFESGFGRTGERDYAPGWAAVLARGLAIDDTTTAALLAYADRLEALMALVPEPADA